MNGATYQYSVQGAKHSNPEKKQALARAQNFRREFIAESSTLKFVLFKFQFFEKPIVHQFRFGQEKALHYQYLILFQASKDDKRRSDRRDRDGGRGDRDRDGGGSRDRDRDKERRRRKK